MSDIVYSIDGERFDDLSSVMDDLRDQLEVGEMIEIEKGIAVKAQHSEFVSGYDFIESMQNSCYDAYGEYSESYLDDLSREKADELNAVIIKWLEDNTESPSFYRVKHIQKVTVEVEG